MKIVTWNANGKFSGKFSEIQKLDTDIYVIQECENPEISKNEEYKEFTSNGYWIGDNQYYGLGIFAKSEIKIDLIDLDNNGLRYFIPVCVNDTFNLLGIWTNPDMDGSKVVQYPKEITEYYEYHKNSGFFNSEMVMCGDFNCDVRLKRTHAKNVFELIDNLNELRLVDSYHYLNDEKEGEESKATFFMYRHLDKPYHLDHVFAAPDKVKYLEIGDENYWTQFSDHIPIVFEVDI